MLRAIKGIIRIMGPIRSIRRHPKDASPIIPIILIIPIIPIGLIGLIAPCSMNRHIEACHDAP